MIAEQRVSIIIPTVNRADDVLFTSIQSLLEQTYGSFEIVVVDQNDFVSDGLVRFIREHTHVVRHVRISEKGLPNARNVGLKHADGEIVLFVDDDIIASPGLVAAHVRNYDDPRIGGVAGRVVRRGIPEERNRVRDAGSTMREVPWETQDTGANPQSTIRNPKSPVVGRFRWWDASFTANYDAEVRAEVDAVYGCNMSFRREVLERVGGFSKAFGGTAHLEETDVSLSIKKLGYRLVFEPDALVQHIYFPTGGCRMNHEELAYWYAHNYVLLFLRHFNRFFLPIFLAERIARVLFWGVERKNFAVSASGLLGLWQGFKTYERLVAGRGSRGNGENFTSVSQGGKKVRILHIITRMVRGGAAAIVMNLTKGLRDSYGIKPVIACGTESGPEGNCSREAKDSGIELIEIPELVRAESFWHDTMALVKIMALLIRRRFDVVHTHTSKAGILGRVAARLAGVPVVVHSSHGIIFEPSGSIPGVSGRRFMLQVFLQAEKFAAKLADAILTLTEIERRDFVRLGIAPLQKLHVLYNAIDVNSFRFCKDSPDEVRRSLGIGKEALVIGCIGRFTREKGHDVLIRAFQMVRRDHPNAHLLLIGDGPERPALENLCVALDVRDAVCFTGVRSDVPSLFRAMDVCVLPSRYEGFGLSTLEAMAAGVPVVATRVGGVPEVVTDGENGLLVPPDDEREMALTIGRILRDRTLADGIRQCARERAVREFDIPVMVERAMKLYLELLSRKL